MSRYDVSAEDIAAVRRFNRFHTRLVGALDDRLLSSEFSLPQMRVLYEVANAPAGGRLSAADLGRDLGLDAGYLSRLVADGLDEIADLGAHDITQLGVEIAERLVEKQ